MISRSTFQRSCVLIGLIGLSVFLFYIGKGHTLLIDTNAVTINGQEFKSAESIEISVDGQEPEPMGRAERIMVSVGGPRHTIQIEVVEDGGKKVERRISIPTFMDMAVVSVPAILGEAPSEHWVTRFTPPPAEEAAAEQMQMQDDTPVEPAPGMELPPSTGTAAPKAP